MKYIWILLVCTLSQYALGQQFDTSPVCVDFDPSISYLHLKELVSKQDGKVLVFAPGKAYLKLPNLHALINLQEKGIQSSVIENDPIYIDPAIEQEGHFDCLQISEDGLDVRINKGVSDTLKGHTKCFLFFVNHTSNTNSWTTAQQSQCINNVLVNLLWWTEQAAAYGIEATFEIETFLFDRPECQITVDPTIAADNIWKTQIMSSLGYDRGNSNEAQLEFLRDQIQAAGSDWGFIGFIIRGANSYRSNAGLFGPSTTCWVNATLNGYTFAHEVGHIFGLRDEYDEIAPLVYGFELNGVPNKNADFRNYINAPCIMKSTIPIGLCMYNPVHLHWTNHLGGLQITMEPEDAIFEVQYLHQQTGQPFFQRRFQGNTVIPMGYGSKLRLIAPNLIETLSGAYESPIWNLSGTDRQDVLLETGGPESVHLNYLPAGNTNQAIAYLPQEDFFTGRRIQIIRNIGSKIITLSNHGLSVNDGSTSTILDREIEVRPGSFSIAFRRALSFSEEEDQQYLVGSQAGIGLPEMALFDGIETAQSWMPPNTFREQGGYIAVSLTKEGHAIGAFEFGGLHVYLTDGSFNILSTSSGLPSANVRCLYKDAQGDIWIGYDGGRQGEELRGLFLLNTSTWTVTPNTKVPDQIRDLSVSHILPFDDGQKLIIIAGNQVYLMEEGLWKLLHQSSNQIFTDVARFSDGRWILSSALGVTVQNEIGGWEIINTDTHLLQENFVRSICVLPSDILLMGHNNAGVTALYSDLSTKVDPSIDTYLDHQIQIFPNPSRNELFLNANSHLGSSSIEIISLDGLSRFQSKVIVEKNNPLLLSIPHNLPNGVYIIRIQSEFATLSRVIQILR